MPTPRRSRGYNRRELEIWDRFWKLYEGGRTEHKNRGTKKRRKGRGMSPVVSQDLGQGEDRCFLMSLPHDIAGRTWVCPCPVGRLVTYLGNCEGTRHSQRGCEPEYEGFDDARSDVVKLYDIGYPRSGPSCNTIDEGITPHIEGGEST